MVLPIALAAVLAASPAPAAPDAPPAATATAATTAPTPPSTPPSAPANPSPAPAGIDSILQGLNSADQSTDAPEEAGPSSPLAPAPAPGPLPYTDLDARAYDRAILAAAQSARAQSGPLDGGWTLAARNGRELYRFQFSDRGLGLAAAEGAWRALSEGPRLAGSGFVTAVGYDGDQVTVSFYEPDAKGVVVVAIKADGASGWAGELRRAGKVTPVVLRRN